jgi:integrase
MPAKAKNYLVERGGWFSFRRRIPQGLVQYVKVTDLPEAGKRAKASDKKRAYLPEVGKVTKASNREQSRPGKPSDVWHVALGTQNKRDAERAARRLTTDTDLLIQRGKAEAARLASLHVHLTAEEREILDSEGGVEGLGRLLDSLRKQTNTIHHAARLSEEVSKRVGPVRPAESDFAGADYDPITDPLQAKIEARTLYEEMRVVEEESARILALKYRASGHLPPGEEAKSAGDSQIDLPLLSARWKAAQPPGTRVAKIDEYAYAAKRWGEFHPRLAVREITRAHITRFRDALATMPASSAPAVRNGTMQHAIAWRQKHNSPALTPGSVRNLVMKVSGLLRYAVEEGFIAANPAIGGMRARPSESIGGRKDGKRVPFTGEEMALILAKLPEASYEDGQRTSKAEEERRQALLADRRWLVKLAAWTGARVEELGQLRKSDVCEMDGVTGLRFGADGMKVKTRGSRRFVPLHPAIRAEVVSHAAGFANSSDRLFPALGTSDRERLTSGVPKWFGSFRKKIGIKRAGVTFHSLRHRFVDCCREVGMPEDMWMRMTGHSTPRGGSGTAVAFGYGQGASMRTVLRTLAKIDVRK